MTDLIDRVAKAIYEATPHSGLNGLAWHNLPEEYKEPSRVAARAAVGNPQCCMCGKKDLSTVEGDGGTECELSDGRWVCSEVCWDKAVGVEE